MNRRQFGQSGITTAIAAASGLSLSAAPAKQALYELRVFELRNDLDVGRVHRFLEQVMIPSLKTRVSGPIGAFNVAIGQFTPAVTLLLQYDSATSLEANTDLVASGKDWVTKWKEFEEGPMPYLHYHSQLFKAFAAHPRIEQPSGSSDSRVFELRVYESKNAFKSAAKIDMFNLEEIKIFRDCAMKPVFFGEALVGTRLPNLTYMLAFDNMGAREKAWSEFRTNPDWNRIKDDPRWVDTVSSIHASFLSATGYSEVR